MRTEYWFIVYIAAFGLLAAGCAETAVSPSPPTSFQADDERLLHLSITTAAGEDYGAALELARSVGAQATSLTVFWDDIETAPGVYRPDPNWLAIANAYYPAEALQVTLTIAVIDTNQLRLPADLANKSFDDPEVIARFKALLDYVATQLPDLPPLALAIGNEIDIYLGRDTAAWTAYETFFAETAVHARTLWPQTPVGSKITFAGINGEPLAAAQAFNRHIDVALVTYYPLDADFKVRPATAVHDDFQTLSAAFPDQQIYLLETGYPTGAANNSSEAKQAAFIRELFTAWDAHAVQIPVVNYTWLTDMPQTAVVEMTHYYELNSPGFVSYLATLGLRAPDGTAKLALAQLAAEAETRGWLQRSDFPR